jgi:hypothetical protein
VVGSRKAHRLIFMTTKEYLDSPEGAEWVHHFPVPLTPASLKAMVDQWNEIDGGNEFCAHPGIRFVEDSIAVFMYYADSKKVDPSIGRSETLTIKVLPDLRRFAVMNEECHFVNEEYASGHMMWPHFLAILPPPEIETMHEIQGYDA